MNSLELVIFTVSVTSQCALVCLLLLVFLRFVSFVDAVLVMVRIQRELYSSTASPVERQTELI